jgi:hypothetical protein
MKRKAAKKTPIIVEMSSGIGVLGVSEYLNYNYIPRVCAWPGDLDAVLVSGISADLLIFCWGYGGAEV